MKKRTIANDVLLPKVSELIAAGHTVTLTVRGHSMNPFLCDRRDRVMLAPCTDADLHPGTVVLAREAGTGRYLLHRIVCRQGTLLTLQGDGNVGLTETAHTHEVIAVMRAALRKGRQYSTDGYTWRTYSRLWRLLRPARRWLLAIIRRI